MVEFKVKEHTYTNIEKKTKYTSVTTVIKQYKIPFDSIKISEAYAKKHPEKTSEGWRAAWAVTSLESTDWGTKIHAVEEDAVRADPSFQEAAVAVDDDTIRSLASLQSLADGFYPELLVWNNKYNIAGQIDKVQLKNNVISITDYKTYKKVDLKSFYNPRQGGFKMMLEPLQMLQDCNFNHTAMQVCTYAFMLEELGYEIGELTLLHLTRDGQRIPYSIDYKQFRMHVLFMLTHYTTNKDGNSN